MECKFIGGIGMIKRPLCCVCLIFLIIQGIILIIRGGQSFVEMPASSIFLEPEGQEICVTGKVCNKKHTSNTQIIYLNNNSIIYDSNFTNVSIGQTIQVQGTIHHFEKARNPGNFDQRLYYAKDKIYAAIYCENIIPVNNEIAQVREKLYQFKHVWKCRLVENMGEEKGNVLSAMLLGEKSEMDADLKEVYQKSGIGHVLAISGLHISFIGLGIYHFLRKIKIPFGIAGILSVGVLSLYACMIGFSISVSRAYVMLLLKIGADVTGRIYDMETALLLSAALSVLKQPLYLTDAGFYLSYGAVLGILILMPHLSNTFMGKTKWLSMFLPGLCINIALFPIQLWYYYEIPTYSFLLNLIVIPLMSGVLTLGIIGSIWPILLPICGQILAFYESVSKLAVQLPFSRIVIGRPKIGELILYYLILGLIVTQVIKKKTPIILSILISVFLLSNTPAKGLQVTMLDVGQGDCLFIKGPTGITYLIDGGSSDVKEVGKYRLEPYLKYEGVGELDYVFVSHGDGDHYSGIMEMISRQDVGVKIDKLVFAENYKEEENLLQLARAAKENGSKIFVFEEGKVLQEEELKITCIQPSAESNLTGNQGSMVLEISYGQFDMLCTGDVEENGERLLARKIVGKAYEVLKVAHHGSKNSSGKEFFDAVSVKFALISAGKDNRYGHPHRETLERLKHENCKIFQTTECGAITIRTDGYFIDILTTSI